MMCGRFTLTADQDMLQAYIRAGYDIKDVPLFDVPRYNIAPSQQVIALLHDGTKHRVGTLTWGFIPPFAKDVSSFSIINAKAETLDQKPAFKQAFTKQRCIILADGFYEWKKENNLKRPMYIYLNDHRIFAMAGIWNTYISEDGNKHHTTAIITTEANQLMSSIHDRMPVILDRDAINMWLDHKQSYDTLKGLFEPYDTKKMMAHEVAPLVNRPTNDVADCIKPL